MPEKNYQNLNIKEISPALYSMKKGWGSLIPLCYDENVFKFRQIFSPFKNVANKSHPCVGKKYPKF